MQNMQINKSIQEDNGELERIKVENSKLESLISTYNNYLSEYQRKFGNELMMEMERRIYSGNFVKNIDPESKKILLNNFSTIKEVEMQNIEKQGRLDFYGQELNRLQVLNDELASENNRLISELEQAREENLQVYNNALSNDQNQMNSSTCIGNKFNITTKKLLEEEFQQAIDEMNNKNNNLLDVIRNLEVIISFLIRI